VHPNIQYEYEAVDAGLYKMCVMLTKMAFNDQFARIKTKVKFSAEFHRSKLIGIPLRLISLFIQKIAEFRRRKKGQCLEIVK
jgi:hypothetical protein